MSFTIDDLNRSLERARNQPFKLNTLITSEPVYHAYEWLLRSQQEKRRMGRAWRPMTLIPWARRLDDRLRKARVRRRRELAAVRAAIREWKEMRA